MSFATTFGSDVHAAQYEWPSFNETVRIIAYADAEHKKTEVKSQKSEELRPVLNLLHE